VRQDVPEHNCGNGGPLDQFGGPAADNILG